MSCDPITHQIDFVKGDDYGYRLTIMDRTVSPAVPLDITGYTVYFTVKSEYTDLDAAAKIQKIVTLHTDPTNGQTLITINAADTINLPVGDYYYDIAWKSPANKNRTIMRGKFILNYHVTYAT